MNKTINELLIEERAWAREVATSPLAAGLAGSRADLLSALKDIGRSGSISAILNAERAVLENDLEHYANSPPMRTSLNTALQELGAAEKTLALVRNPEAYQTIGQAMTLPKAQIRGLPKDDARLFFSAQAARLLNQDKSRLDDDEKKIIDQRKNNMRSAEKAYAALQEKALGRDQGQGQGADLAL